MRVSEELKMNAELAGLYLTLAKYYEYRDPQTHYYYYAKHFQYAARVAELARREDPPHGTRPQDARVEESAPAEMEAPNPAASPHAEQVLEDAMDGGMAGGVSAVGGVGEVPPPAAMPIAAPKKEEEAGLPPMMGVGPGTGMAAGQVQAQSVPGGAMGLPPAGLPFGAMPGGMMGMPGAGTPGGGVPSGAPGMPSGMPGMPGAGLPSGMPGVPGAGLPSEVPGMPGAGMPSGMPGAGMPSGMPGMPGAGMPSGMPGMPGAGLPSGMPGMPGVGLPSGMPGMPGAGMPSGMPGMPGAGMPSGMPGMPGAGMPSGMPGMPGAGMPGAMMPGFAPPLQSPVPPGTLPVAGMPGSPLTQGMPPGGFPFGQLPMQSMQSAGPYTVSPYAPPALQPLGPPPSAVQAAYESSAFPSMESAGGAGQSSARDSARVRAIHAVPDAPAVDVYVNGQKLLNNIAYRATTSFITVPSGTYQVDVFPAGSTGSAILSERVTIGPGAGYTLAATGTAENPSLHVYQEELQAPPGSVRVRFIQLSPDAPALEIVTKNGNVLFPNVGYKDATRYATVAPGTYNLSVREAGGSRPIFSVPSTRLTGGHVYSIVITGFTAGTPGLEAKVLRES
jgi:hypothetical protein